MSGKLHMFASSENSENHLETSSGKLAAKTNSFYVKGLQTIQAQHSFIC